MHLHRRAADPGETGPLPTSTTLLARPPRRLRAAPLSRTVLGMPGRVWSMVAWSLLSAALLLTSIALPLSHSSGAPVVTLSCIAILLVGAAVGVLARERTPDWWLYTNTGLWILVTCWLLLRSSLLEDGLLLFGVVICAVYVGYWFPRHLVMAYALAWSAATLVVFLIRGRFEHTALMWLTATCVSVALALFLSTLTTYLHQQAIRDPLTGLLNRAGLLDVVAGLTPTAIEDLSPVTAVLLDLDDFKKVNDTRGHAAGDAALVAVAAALRRGLRSHDIIARTGGDEFLVILPQTSERDAVAAIERIAADCDYGWSFGSAPWRAGATFDDLSAVADRAMYAMKAARAADQG